MIKLCKPTIYVSDIWKINYEELKMGKIKLLCFDLDNTLDRPDKLTEVVDLEVRNKLELLKKDFEILIVSNNTIKNRVASFATQVDLEYIEGMRKPFLKKYKNNSVLNKYQKDEVIFIGDKISTDVIGANRFGSSSILVDPLYPKNKKWYAFVMHFIDKGLELLSGYRRGNYFNDWSKNE